MIPRGIVTAAAVVATAVAVCALLSGAGERRRADQATARADSLATEALIDRARADGWEVAFGDTIPRLLDLIAAGDSQSAGLARELAAARTELRSRTVLVASSSGAAEAPRDPVASSADSTVYLVEDGPLRGVITVWADSAAARLDWSVEITAELYDVEAADRRRLLLARSPDPRVQVSIPTFELPRLAPERAAFPWRCVLSAGGTGAAVVATERWEVGVGGVLLTWRMCR